jgi:hypothetical protein
LWNSGLLMHFASFKVLASASAWTTSNAKRGLFAGVPTPQGELEEIAPAAAASPLAWGKPPAP